MLRRSATRVVTPCGALRRARSGGHRHPHVVPGVPEDRAQAAGVPDEAGVGAAGVPGAGTAPVDADQAALEPLLSGAERLARGRDLVGGAGHGQQRVAERAAGHLAPVVAVPVHPGQPTGCAEDVGADHVGDLPLLVDGRRGGALAVHAVVDLGRPDRQARGHAGRGEAVLGEVEQGHRVLGAGDPAADGGGGVEAERRGVDVPPHGPAADDLGEVLRDPRALVGQPHGERRGQHLGVRGVGVALLPHDLGETGQLLR